MDDENTSPTDVLYLRLETGEFDARFCVTIIIIHNYNFNYAYLLIKSHGIFCFADSQEAQTCSIDVPEEVVSSPPRKQHYILCYIIY